MQTARNLALAIGVATFCGGVLLLLSHRREVERVANDASPDRKKRFERRKYRRRAAASSLIASVGILLAGLYWVNERPVFTIFVTLILGLLGLISVLAMVDFFSVGLHQLATPDEQSERAVLEEIVRRHREARESQEDSD